MSSTVTHTTSSTPSIPLISSTSNSSSNPITAKLRFFQQTADGEAPYNYVEKPPEGKPQNNLQLEEIKLPINDIRGVESSFSLDRNAFLPIPANTITTTSNASFATDETVRETYYPEVERLLLENLPGSPKRVLIFDHTIRRQTPGANREPVLRVHIDQTTTSAKQRVHFHLPDEAESLLQGRVRLVNVWRPLNGPVESSPLAVGDGSTVSDEQLVGVRHLYPDRVGETAVVKHGSEKWYYWSGMRNDERLLLQCYDSEFGSRVPHTAFKFEGEGEEGWTGKPRESIEVRALIFG